MSKRAPGRAPHSLFSPSAPGLDAPFPAARLFAGGALIVLTALVVYGPALSGDVLWDDDRYVSENPLLVAKDGLWRIWTSPRESPQYYPLVFTSFWVEGRLWGLSTFGLHLVNVLLHATNALLLWSVLRRLRVPGAWLAGAVFALHPVHVESVAWITERKNVLSGLFYLLTFSAYLQFAERRRWGVYALSLTLFACALLSKTVTCSLPFAILLCLWWKRDRVTKRDYLPVLPFLALGVPLGLMTVWLEKHHVGAMGEIWQLTFPERFLVAGRALWFYAAKLVWPADLVFNYPRWGVSATALWQWMFPVAFLAALALLWRLRDRFGKGPPAALAFFAITLSPALGFFDVYPFRFSYVADHFQYHASLGLIALLAAAVTLTLRRWTSGGAGGRQWLPRAAFIVPLIFGVLTHRQAGLYTDIETLWRRTIAQNPKSWLARQNLALLLLRDYADDPAAVREAEQHFEVVVDLNPTFADPHINLGNIAGRRGRHDEAMTHYRTALSIEPTNPSVHYNMARELYRAGETDDAVAAYQTCLEIDPTSAPAYNGLGRILLERGRLQQAGKQFRLALETDPRNAWALHNLGTVAESQGSYHEAIAYYKRALDFKPDLVDSWYRTAACLRTGGDLEASKNAYHESLSLDPHHADAISDLATIAFGEGRFAEAVEGYRRALELSPANLRLRINLVVSHERLGNEAAAITVLKDGLALQPHNLSLMHQLAKRLATATDESLREGTRTLALAKQVVDRLDTPTPEAYATLAAAHAELCEYKQAAAATERALELARSRSMPDLEQHLAERLREYRSHTGDPE